LVRWLVNYVEGRAVRGTGGREEWERTRGAGRGRVMDEAWKLVVHDVFGYDRAVIRITHGHPVELAGGGRCDCSAHGHVVAAADEISTVISSAERRV
jgi:hypothetical protein